MRTMNTLRILTIVTCFFFTTVGVPGLILFMWLLVSIPSALLQIDVTTQRATVLQ